MKNLLRPGHYTPVATHSDKQRIVAVCKAAGIRIPKRGRGWKCLGPSNALICNNELDFYPATSPRCSTPLTEIEFTHAVLGITAPVPMIGGYEVCQPVPGQFQIGPIVLSKDDIEQLFAYATRWDSGS